MRFNVPRFRERRGTINHRDQTLVSGINSSQVILFCYLKWDFLCYFGGSLWRVLNYIRVVWRQRRSPGSNHHQIEAMVKVFQKNIKLQGQGHDVKNYGTMWKVLSQGIHMCNIKALSFLVHLRKLWPRLKFFKSRSNFKARSYIMLPRERSCHKEYTFAIWKPYLFWWESYGQG